MGRLLLLCVLALLVLGCGQDASTEPSSAPARLVSLSPAVDTLFSGETADPPLSVRVENALGDPVEGIPVRFLLLTEGAGRLDAMAVSDRQGIAEAEFEAGGEPVEARIRADVPSAGNVSALEFRLVVVPASSVTLARGGGNDQEAEVGSQLPLPFVVRATTPGGADAGGVPIAWSLQANAASARLTADTSFTDVEGRARTILTLGTEAREYAVTAHAARGVVSDTVRFTARAVAAVSGAVRLDSVRPLPLEAGEDAVAFGAGFPSAPELVEIRIEGEPGRILESAVERIGFVVPDFADRCLPAREVGVRVLAGSETSNGTMAELVPREPAVDLAAGEALTLAPPALDCVQLPGGTEGREYWLAVQSASRSAEARAAVRLLARSADDIGFGQPAASVAGRGIDPAVRDVAEGSLRPELELRAGVRRELRRRGVAPSRRATFDPTAATLSGGAAVPAAGDTLEFTFAVGPDLAATCADTTNRVRGLVRAVGDHHVLVTDLEAPPAGFTEEDLRELGAEFDRLVFPTDTAYFGSPADLDGNDRIVLLLTPEVNELTPSGGDTFIGGFFLALDLAASGGGAGVPASGTETCPASNEAEILYMAVPDADGRFGDPLTVSQARRLLRELMPHELQHLINAEGRVLTDDAGFDALEETWLDEGLSHIAEEVSGLELLGLGRGQNLGFDRVAGTRTALDAFNAFHIQNFFNLSVFMLDPANSPTLAAVDPGGIATLQLRGFAWALLRWLADHEGGGDERVLFRSLAGGGQSRLQGIANVELASGARWEDLLADFVAAIPVDDAGAEISAERLRIPTWNLRDIYAGLNANAASGRRFPLPFPLAFERLRFESAAIDFELNASTVKYFDLRGGLETPPLALTLRSPGGGAPAESAAPQITIVRRR